MLAYLQAENAYADQLLAPLKPLEDTLYKEIPLRDRPGLPDPRAPQGQHGGGRGSPAGRQRDGGRQGLLQRRFDGSEPGQPAAGLGRR
ncbi:hypothetical protein G6F59_018158 [Rhizopus arrhizus]|nr:hypothetical protein G6F59_018158 [Rhizopus arrhizus]